MLYNSEFDLKRPSDFLRKSQPRTRTPYSLDTASDYGRIVHSMCFRRLQGKMQLFPPAESPLLRNRLSHSLEVTDIASRITANLNKRQPKDGPRIDGYMVTAVALAHDLGHPPFGHTGEQVLARLMSEYGSFEGNAQTLRILTRLENRFVHQGIALEDEVYEKPLGLNLLLRTIAGVIKYDNKIPIRNDDATNTDNLDIKTAHGKLEKGYYEDDSEIVELVRSNVITRPADAGRPLKTIECQIMDLADDIAYSTYDFEDCMIAGITHPLDLIAISDDIAKDVAARTTQSLTSKYGYTETLDFVDILVVYQKLFRNIIRMNAMSDYHMDSEFDKAAYLGWNYQNSLQMASIPLKRRKITEHLIESAVDAVKIVSWDSSCPALTTLEIDPQYLLYIEALKHYNYIDAIMHRRLRLYAERAEQILETLFDVLKNNKGDRLFPKYWKPYAQSILKTNDSTKRMRLICDYLSSLTDDEAIKLYSRVTSADHQTVFHPTD